MRYIWYLFFVVSTVALLPSWAFAAMMWRRKYGKWVLVNPSSYARCEYQARGWLLFLMNNIFWTIVFAVYAGVRLSYHHFFRN